MKVALIILGVLAALVLAAVAVLAFALDPVVLKVAREESSEALGVPVQIDEADASLGGSLELEGFRAANPEGFAEPRAVRFDRIAVRARLGSLLGRVVEVDELLVERPELTIEFRDGRSNVGVFMDRLSGRPAKEADDGKKFRIKRLRVANATVRFRADVLGEETRDVTLPPIELKDVGTTEDAAGVGDVLAAVFQAMAREALTAARGLLPAELLGSLGGELDAVKQRLGEWIRRMPDVLEQDLQEPLKKKVEKGVEEGLERLRRGLPR